MSYLTIATIAHDDDIILRVTAAAAQEQKSQSPDSWVGMNIWAIAASPGWSEAWEYAVASGNPDPGSDEGVITDGMILAAVQPLP